VTEAATEAVTETTTEAAGETAMKTGLSVTVSLKDSNSADAENAGNAKYDVTVVAVSVDESGVIESCLIDSIPATVSFDTTGAITSDLTAEILTKNELGENYGMKLYGGAKYEWNEQAAALADYAEGKTLEELKNGAVDETGMAKDADLASTATIYLGGYVAAIEDAVNQAQYLGAQKGDELRMATISSVGSSAAADAEKDGTAQMDTDITVLTMNEGVITSCYIDSVQAKVNFNTAGEVTSDLSAPVQTKNQLGENYGMKLYGGSAYEWNEQAAAFAGYVTGKTLEEVLGIAVNESTVLTDADIASTVTIAVGGFQGVIEKAAK
jgi:predicted ATPase